MRRQYLEVLEEVGGVRLPMKEILYSCLPHQTPGAVDNSDKLQVPSSRPCSQFRTLTR